MIKSEKGFTLIEAIISTAILIVMVLSLYTFFVSGLFSSVRGQGKARAVQTARLAMDGELTNPRNPGLIDELRLGDTISLALPNTIGFETLDTMAGIITYSYQGPDPKSKTGSILRSDTHGSVTIADHILKTDGLRFTYFDIAGNTIPPSTEPVRQVDVEIKVDINGDGQADAALKTRVVPRNIP